MIDCLIVAHELIPEGPQPWTLGRRTRTEQVDTLVQEQNGVKQNYSAGGVKPKNQKNARNQKQRQRGKEQGGRETDKSEKSVCIT